MLTPIASKKQAKEATGKKTSPKPQRKSVLLNCLASYRLRLYFSFTRQVNLSGYR